MLPPIPYALLKDTAVFHVTTGIDSWKHRLVVDHKVTNVHIQPSNETRKTAENTEVVLSAILFVDCKRSKPFVNLLSLQEKSQNNGEGMTVTIYSRGNARDYTVRTVEDIPDIPSGKTHHFELGLV